MQTCRFCKSWKNPERMVKYGVRHYAHFACYLDAGKRLEDLHDWQIIQCPALLLRNYGLWSVGKAALAREKVREAMLPAAEAAE